MILIKLLAAGQCAPGNSFVDIGITRVIADLFGFKTAPCRRGNNLARLRLYVMEADFVIFARQSQMRMIQSGDFGLRRPRL